jgi:class 3 adenylate cyclase
LCAVFDMPQKDSHNNFDLSSEDIRKVDGFRRSKETAVLVIMFTDLEGSTEIAERLGERYAQKVRQIHEKILVEIIERQTDGLNIKNIGDSLMSIFAEPSTAVERALDIQAAVRVYNTRHPDEEPIVVRIGMHMGQVSVQDQTQIDVFGRHVNRAARVESLSEGGHVYMTYPVYDSAQGWLKGQRNLIWKNHGSYVLKGISEPIQIYEVADPSVATPMAPTRPPVVSGALSNQAFIDQLVINRMRTIRYHSMFLVLVVLLGFLVVTYGLVTGLSGEPIKTVLTIGGGLICSVGFLQIREIMTQKGKCEILKQTATLFKSIVAEDQRIDAREQHKLDDLLWRLVEKVSLGA